MGIYEHLRNKGLSGEELELKARAIEIVHDFPLREWFWLGRLHGWESDVGVFVCGDVHIETFPTLLQTEGIEHRVWKRGVGVNEQDALYYCAMEYLKEHPEIAQEYHPPKHG